MCVPIFSTTLKYFSVCEEVRKIKMCIGLQVKYKYLSLLFDFIKL
jgi:hypothetical protein